MYDTRSCSTRRARVRVVILSFHVKYNTAMTRVARLHAIIWNTIPTPFQASDPAGGRRRSVRPSRNPRSPDGEVQPARRVKTPSIPALFAGPESPDGVG